jgi:hypothetical protein
MITFINGKKTYIVAFVCIVAGVLAWLHVIPNPEQVGEYAVAIGALAWGFRSAISKVIDAIKALTE